MERGGGERGVRTSWESITDIHTSIVYAPPCAKQTAAETAAAQGLSPVPVGAQRVRWEDGQGGGGWGDICTRIADLLHRTAETNTTVLKQFHYNKKWFF